MNRRKRFLIQPKIVLRLCLIICAVLLFLSFRYQDAFLPVKNAAGDLITPMQKGINTIGRKIAEKIQLFRDIDSLVEENSQLKKELEQLRLLNSYQTSDKHELDNLRALYQVGEKYPDYPKIAARVISKEPNSYYSIFTIDKGYEDGIRVDMNVLAGNGLCGIVIETGRHHAIIRTIVDDASYVSGMFLKTSDTCDVKGSLDLLDSGYIYVDTISIHAEIAENDEIVTSHISEKYLQGILIGYVANIELDYSSMTKKAYLKPVVDFEHLEEVLVITELKQPLKDMPDEDSYESIYGRAAGLSLEEKKRLQKEILELIENEEARLE